MMGGGLIVGGAVVAVVFVISLDRRVRNAFQGVSVAFQNVCTSNSSLYRYYHPHGEA